MTGKGGTRANAIFRRGEMDEGIPGPAFEQIVLTIVVNTGLVSHLVEDCYNCAVAHSVCYGLDPVLAETVAGPDMEHIPYPVTKEMVWEAMRRVEAFRSRA